MLLLAWTAAFAILAAAAITVTLVGMRVAIVRCARANSLDLGSGFCPDRTSETVANVFEIAAAMTQSRASLSAAIVLLFRPVLCVR
jgi:hypothetical protein